MAKISSRYYLFQLGPDSAADSLGGGRVRITGRIPPDLAIGETPSELPLSHMVGSLSSSDEGAGVVGELIPAERQRPDSLSVVIAVTLPLAAVVYLLMPGVRADFRDFFLLLVAAPVLLLSGISMLAEALEAARRGIVAPALFHLAGAVAAYAYGVALVLQRPLQGEGGRYFLYALTLAALPVLYKLGPSLARAVYFQCIAPSSLPAYLDVEQDDVVRPVPTYRVQEGMIIVLSVGMTVPVECVVESGECEVDYTGIVDLSTLRPGDLVHAGVIIHSGEIRARVVHVPDVRVVEASTRLRIGSAESRHYDTAMNLMSALAILVVMAGAIFHVRTGGEEWPRALVISLVIAGALPLEAVELLGRLADTLFADLAAARGIACCSEVTPARLAGVKEFHSPVALVPETPPDGVTIRAEGVPRPGEAVIVTGMDSEASMPGGVIRVYAGPREGASRNAVILLTGRMDELWRFLSGARRVRRAGVLAYVFSLAIGGTAAFLAAAGILEIYVALVFGAVAALWGEMILASGSEGR